MADRSIAMPQTRRVVTQRLAPAETGEDFLDHGGVRVKFGYVPADILFACIPEKIELGLVHPQDCSVRAHPVKADRRGLHEVAQQDRKSTRLNSSHVALSRMPSS